MSLQHVSLCLLMLSVILYLLVIYSINDADIALSNLRRDACSIEWHLKDMVSEFFEFGFGKYCLINLVLSIIDLGFHMWR